MSARETISIIVRARREGVTLFAKADGKLGLKADRPPSDELLAILKEHKADILALLVPPVRASLHCPARPSPSSGRSGRSGSCGRSASAPASTLRAPS